MDTLEAILTRRSIRQYTSELVTDDQLLILLKAAMFAPSAVNKQPWHFIVFRDKETVKKIIEVHPNASMLSRASAAILVCWDETLQHDTGYGPVDCSAATQNILLAAHNMGLGSVWAGVYPRLQRMDDLAKIFSLPPHIKAFSIVALGFPAEKKEIPERYIPERIHNEKW